jgi:Fe-S-cluster containining protein
MIEPEKARALDAHDFSAYTQLADRTLYYDDKNDSTGLYRLAKGEGTRCIFLDSDDLCIIHKELGPDAKPNMCRQFPFLASHTWVDDRISVNYGCPSVQQQRGEPLADQADEITGLVPRTQRDLRPDATVPFDGTCTLTRAENEAFVARAMSMFDCHGQGNVWDRFAELLATLVGIRQAKSTSSGENANLVSELASDRPISGTPDVPDVCAYPVVTQSPTSVRFLFAVTLFPDTVPPDAVTGMGLIKRLTLIPKLMSLATMKGAYASRLLGRNIAIGDVMDHELDEDLDAGATQLLLRYYRSRLWQQFLGGTRLNIAAGIHQHVQDLNAIMFLARAIAQHTGAAQLNEYIICQALKSVEFHLANQARLFDQTLKGWIRGQLASPELAFASLKLMSLKPAPIDAPTTAED